MRYDCDVDRCLRSSPDVRRGARSNNADHRGPNNVVCSGSAFERGYTRRRCTVKSWNPVDRRHYCCGWPLLANDGADRGGRLVEKSAVRRTPRARPDTGHPHTGLGQVLERLQRGRQQGALHVFVLGHRVQR